MKMFSRLWKFFPKTGWGLALIAAVLLLSACAAGGEELPPKRDENVLIYAALNPVTNSEIQRYINRFNNEHTDVQIEVRDYSDEGGIQRLLTELALGQVPDIMELRRIGKGWFGEKGFVTFAPNIDRPEGEEWMPYRQMIQKGYLEDLWPYIESDPDLGREGVLEAPLKAAEVDGGLYMLFKQVSVTTLLAPIHVVGDRVGWTLEELLETFATMPEDSTIFRYGTTRQEVYFRLLCAGLDQFVDWSTGTCSFNSQEFFDMVELLGAFPDEFRTDLSVEDLENEVKIRRLFGQQMLEPRLVGRLDTAAVDNIVFGLDNPTVYIGFPTVDGSPSSFFNMHGRQLAMSSTCHNKEAAWDFMRLLVTRHYRSKERMRQDQWETLYITPVNRMDFDMGNGLYLKARKEDMFPYETFRGGPVFEPDPPTEADLQRYEDLINSTTRIFWPDDELSDIVWECLGPYFAGDRSLEDTIRQIESRVGLYISENQ